MTSGRQQENNTSEKDKLEGSIGSSSSRKGKSPPTPLETRQHCLSTETTTTTSNTNTHNRSMNSTDTSPPDCISTQHHPTSTNTAAAAPTTSSKRKKKKSKKKSAQKMSSPVSVSHLICSFPSGRQEFIWDNSPMRSIRSTLEQAESQVSAGNVAHGQQQTTQQQTAAPSAVNGGKKKKKKKKQASKDGPLPSPPAAKSTTDASKASPPLVNTTKSFPQPQQNVSSPSGGTDSPSQSSTGSGKKKRKSNKKTRDRKKKSAASVQRDPTSYYNTNIHAFFKHTTPKLSTQSYSLREDLWPFFDEPYGIEVPVTLNGEKDFVYFVPHLSGFYLEECAPGGGNASSSQRGKDQSAGQRIVRSSTHFETRQPSERNYISDEIEILAQEHPLLYCSDNTRLSQNSFFSILWVPIMCHNSTIMYLSGEFLCYYSFQAKKEFVDGTPNDVEDMRRVVNNHPSANAENKEDDSSQTASEVNSEDSIVQVKPEQEGSSSAKSVFYAPLIGFVPYKVRNDTWFTNTQQLMAEATVLSAPLHLVEAVPQLLKDLTLDHSHPDFEHIRPNFTLKPEVTQNAIR